MHAPGSLTLPRMKDPMLGLFLRLRVPTTLYVVLGPTVQMETRSSYSWLLLDYNIKNESVCYKG